MRPRSLRRRHLRRIFRSRTFERTDRYRDHAHSERKFDASRYLYGRGVLLRRRVIFVLIVILALVNFVLRELRSVFANGELPSIFGVGDEPRRFVHSHFRHSDFERQSDVPTGFRL